MPPRLTESFLSHKPPDSDPVADYFSLTCGKGRVIVSLTYV